MKEEIEEAQRKFLEQELEKSVSVFLTNFPRIFESVIPLSETGLSARNFIHWKEMKLLPPLNAKVKGEKRKWVKLNMLEFLWIKFLQSLRDFGIGMEEIKRIKEMLLSDPIKLTSPEAVDKFAASDIIYKDSKLMLSKISDFYNLIPPTHRIAVTPFGSCISAIQFLQKSTSIIIFSVPSEEESSNTEEKTRKQHKSESELYAIPEGINDTEFIRTRLAILRSLPHIIIPLRPFMERFFESEENIKHAVDFSIINQDEMNLLESVRKNDYKQIVIKRDKNQNLVIDIIKEQNLREEKLKELRKILGLKDYQKITITYRNDKEAYVENIIRQK